MEGITEGCLRSVLEQWRAEKGGHPLAEMTYFQKGSYHQAAVMTALPGLSPPPPELRLTVSCPPVPACTEREAELEAFSANAPPLYTHSVWSVVLRTCEAFFSMLTSCS